MCKLRFTHIIRLGKITGAAASVALCLPLLTGCQAQQPKADPPPNVVGISDPRGREKPPEYIDASKVEMRDDIKEICAYWREPMLFRNNDIPAGFRATVFFVSGGTQKGAFVPGVIRVQLFVADERKSFAKATEPVHEWRLDAREAMNWRIRRASMLGYGYGLMLPWPDVLNLEGRRIAIEIGYERGDGTVVRSRRRTVDVPWGPDYEERRAIRNQARSTAPAKLPASAGSAARVEPASAATGGGEFR